MSSDIKTYPSGTLAEALEKIAAGLCLSRLSRSFLLFRASLAARISSLVTHALSNLRLLETGCKGDKERGREASSDKGCAEEEGAEAEQTW